MLIKAIDFVILQFEVYERVLKVPKVGCIFIMH